MAIVDLIETQKCLFICNGGSCLKKDEEDLTAGIRKAIAEAGLKDKIHTVRTKCIGRCDDAPVVFSAPDNRWYKEVFIDKIPDFIENYINNNSLKGEFFLYEMGQKTINSESVPTIKRKKKDE